MSRISRLGGLSLSLCLGLTLATPAQASYGETWNAGDLFSFGLLQDLPSRTYRETSTQGLQFDGDGSQSLEHLFRFDPWHTNPSAQTAGTVWVEWTRPATGNADNDPFFGITDGTYQVSVEYGNDSNGTWWFNEGAYNGASPGTFARTWSTLATNVGYSTGSAHTLEIDFEICADGTTTFTEVRSSFGGSAGPVTASGTLDASSGVQLWVGAHEPDEPLTVEHVSWQFYTSSSTNNPFDSDGDGITDTCDNCPSDANTTQADGDGDGFGDACDALDSDGDGVLDEDDAFPNDPTESVDTDGDGVGDNADVCVGYPNDDADGDRVCDADDVCPTDATDADADGDGVCDVEDVCVGLDNVDTDGDQVCDDLDQCEGNDASGDQDGDLVCDGSDNCPADANATQADADGDDIGDACEADTDGDGIIDDDDNCIDDHNFDQSDNDGDGDGDACDTDDDGDGVADTDDVCPFVADAAQTDTDGDGYGDACDGDDDGDGVADAADSCPGTPLDAPFDADGCSGEQRVELECGTPADYSWRRSGQYIRCVVRESRSAWRAGLVTHREKAWMIRQATVEMWLQRYISRLRRWC